VVLEAHRGENLDAVILKNGIIPSEEKLIATLGKVLITLMNGAQESSFPQLPSELTAKRILVYGDVLETGAKAAGDGFTVVKNAAGKYTVTFSKEMSIAPGVGVTPVTTTIIPLHAITEITKTKFVVQFWNFAGGAAADCGFSFIGIG
jgi:hypothetical protein